MRKQALKVGQKQAWSVMGRQAGNNRWKDSPVAEHILAVSVLEQRV